MLVFLRLLSVVFRKEVAWCQIQAGHNWLEELRELPGNIGVETCMGLVDIDKGKHLAGREHTARLHRPVVEGMIRSTDSFCMAPKNFVAASQVLAAR